MKIFLTGSCGFIGCHLRERLEKEGYQVIGMDNLSHPCKYHKKPEIVDNIRNIWDYADIIAECDFVINLAAWISVEKSLIDPERTSEVNFISAMKVLTLCDKLGVPLIHASSSEIYGDRATETAMDENHSTFPKSPYAASKLAIDGMMHAYYHSYGTKVIIVRNFNTMGKYQSNNKFGAVISIFAEKLMRDSSPIVFGDGKQKRDFMGYRDAVDFYMLVMEKAEKEKLWGQEFNVGMGKSITIMELAVKMANLFYKKGETSLIIHSDPRPGEVKEFICDNSKARALGWKPDTDFDKLLKEFIDWKKGEKNGK